MSDAQKPQDHEVAARNARELIDPKDPPRAFFVGVSYDSGSDYAHGVNKASVDSGEAALDVIETLAVHVNVVAQAIGKDREEVAAYALEVAKEQEQI